ncbi:hypothetical protein Celaphus_00004304, partial [Cervus elaphus hippelaphus]
EEQHSMLGSGFKAERLRVNLRLVINRLKLELDSGLAESVSTLIWAAPRLQSEVAELKIVADQLCAKYSKEYGKLCRTNQIGTVNDRLMHKLSVEAPPKILVERYLIEIAKNYNVPYEPDSVVMSDFNGLPVGTYQAFPNIHPPQIPATPPSYESVDDINADKNVSSTQIVGPGPKPEAPAKPASRPTDTYDNFVLPELPSVPDTLPTASAGANTSASEDIDFDDLSRRFEELKKKT